MSDTAIIGTMGSILFVGILSGLLYGCPQYDVCRGFPTDSPMVGCDQANEQG